MVVEISIIIPVYGCGNVIERTVKGILKVIEPLNVNFEIILIDDRAPDNAWQVISRMTSQNPAVKGIKLSRNFGQESAILAGCSYAKGEFIVLMDCDMQESPEYIRVFYSYLKQGEADIVFSIRKQRKQGFFRKIFTRIYNWIFKNIAGVNFTLEFSSLMAFNRKVLQHFLSFKDKHRIRAGLLMWLGFKRKFVYIDHLPSLRGKTSYSFMKFLRVAVDAWVSQSTRLLYLSVFLGVLFAFFALLGTVYVIVNYFLHGFLPGWASLITAILVSTSVILFQLGILGIYIAKMFEQVKDRPMFVVEETKNVL